MTAPRYLIQFDAASRAYPYRVVTYSGTCIGYFRNRLDAMAYCGARP